MRNNLLISVSTLALLGAGISMPASATMTMQQAQQTGNVSGKITNADGSSALGGAIVRITGLNRQVTTDGLGQFRLTGLPVGDHTATVTYFGADSFTVTISVKAGENTGVTLNSVNDDLDEIVVTGVIGSINASRSLERSADTFKSVMASDAVGQFGDQNIAEALQRMPGISIIRNEGEGNFVSVRGLSAGFNQVTLNGAEIGSDGDTRGTSLQFIGTNLLESVEVTKTITPDMSASSTGGQINIKSASAFRAGKNTLQASAEGSYQDYAGKISPKLGLSGTWLNKDETFGVAFAGNYYNRYIDGNEYVNGDGLKLFKDGDGGKYDLRLPGEADQRREVGERERFNINLGLEYRPTAQDEFTFHGTYARVRDNDLKIREEIELDKADDGGEVVAIDAHSFTLIDVEKKTDFWMQQIYNKSYAFDFGGKHTRGDWTVEYQVAASEARSDREGSARARWKAKDFAVRGDYGEDFINVELIPYDEAQAFIDDGFSSSKVKGDVLDPSKHDWDLAWFDDSLKGDNVKSARFDITKDMILGNASGYFKFGALYLERSVDQDQNRPGFNPDSDYDSYCSGDTTCIERMSYTMADFGARVIPEGSILVQAVPTWDNVLPIVESMRDIVPAILEGHNSSDNSRRDYTANEKVTSAYTMGNFDVSEKLRIIAGLRMEHTSYEATGFLSLENDEYVLPAQAGTDIRLAVIEPMPLATKSYTDFFPSLIARFNPTDNIVVRASVTRSTKRPSFSEAQNSALIDSDIELIDPISGDTYEDDYVFTQAEFDAAELDIGGKFDVGNPQLEPLMSTNLDFSVGWYPSKSTYLSVGVFYKDITNWIATVKQGTGTFSDIPVVIPDLAEFPLDNDIVFENINLAVNGDEATVKGIELAFSHVFASGFFVDANAAFIDSSSTLNDKRTDVLPLIGQADKTANLSVGYENDKFSVRVVGNHRGEFIYELGGTDDDTHEDQFSKPYTGLDISARYYLNDNIQFYFDAINLTNAKETKNYRGDALSGRSYAEISDFGSTYQLGVKYRF